MIKAQYKNKTDKKYMIAQVIFLFNYSNYSINK